MKKQWILPLLAASALLVAACTQTPSSKAKEAVEAGTSAKVARIVFVGQKQACDCTRKRIEASWNVLDEVLKARPKLPVERIQRDVNKQAAQKVFAHKPLMVAPGIYFLDAKGGLVKLLQGEVSKAQIEQLLL